MNKFSKEFKEKAIKLHEAGISAKKIFEDAGIDTNGKHKNYANKLISRWKNNKQEEKKLNSKEVQSLRKIKKEEERKKIEYLEAQVAYLKAENDFLTKLPKEKKN